MLAALLVFVLVAGVVLGGYAASVRIPGSLARRRIELRLREIGQTTESSDESIVVKEPAGPLPAIDRVLGRMAAGSRLAKLIEQSGIRTTPSAIVVASVASGVAALLATQALLRHSPASLVAAPLGTALPLLFLVQRRSSRLRRFEEQFPEALDLVSRAIRAGHAFQTAIGMAAEELPPPVGPEFKKVFDQQNFGLPLGDALAALADRVPLLDVKFFVTAVAIQRDTGGNLAEILDNLSHVVRERFKIQRQVRVHTAHGRITGLVLLGLPPFLAAALSVINPEHMRPLFEERIGHMLILATIVMQLIGFVWIRRVIKIEV
ncbi:MAG: type II secretion system F family protein [Acidobacteria bacterium]|nr:type II secretion system F family protein [Acidobacteriota bacterium]